MGNQKSIRMPNAKAAIVFCVWWARHFCDLGDTLKCDSACRSQPCANQAMVPVTVKPLWSELNPTIPSPRSESIHTQHLPPLSPTLPLCHQPFHVTLIARTPATH